MNYAAISVINPTTGNWELMSSSGRVIVFDTAELAWNWLPLLGGGRTYKADSRRLEIWFFEISNNAPNRAKVVPQYDLGELMPWRKHIIWSEWAVGKE